MEVPRLKFDAEIVNLAETLFVKDEELGDLGTLPGLVARRDGEEVAELEPGAELFSDEEDLELRYHNIRSQLQYSLGFDLISQSASFRQAQAHGKSFRHWFPSVKYSVAALCSGEAAAIISLNA